MHHASQRQRKQRERKLPPEEDPEFQIAPMIDILLVLLVFFMSIATKQVLQKTEGIRLPVAAKAGDRPEGGVPGEVIINVRWVELGGGAGSIVIDTKDYEKAEDFIPILTAALKTEPLTRVLIRADRAVRFAYMREIIKSVASAGITNVTFSAVNRDEEAPPTAPAA